MPAATLASLVATFCFALLQDGFQKALALLGKSLRRRTFRMMPRRPFIKPCGGIYCAPIVLWPGLPWSFRFRRSTLICVSRFASALAQRAPSFHVLMIFLDAANRTFSRMRAPVWSTTLGASRARKSRLRMLRRTCPIPTDSHAI